jgi:hypothetical protein
LKINNTTAVQKTKEHFKKNKKGYVIGGVCFAAGSILTYLTARPSIGTLNVYHQHFSMENKGDVLK